MKRRLSRVLLATLTLVAALGAPAMASPALDLSLLSQYNTGLGSGGAEISAYDPATRRLFIVNGVNNTLSIVDLADPAAAVLVTNVSLAVYGAAGNSVATAGGVVAVAVQAAIPQDPGRLVMLDTNGNHLNDVAVGSLPDMVTFVPDGTKLLVANEGEPNSAYTVDPQGTVSIVDISGGVGSAVVIEVNFVDFNVGNPRHVELPPAVRIFGPGATVAMDLEPEFITTSADGLTAWVSLQENNAIAVIDVASASVIRIDSLGFKDFSPAGNGLDPSDENGGIAIANWPVFGMYQPDALASMVIGGTQYVLSANEGDARDYAGLAEEVRVGNAAYPLDPTQFPNAAVLKQNANLGRLTVTRRGGDLDADTDYDRIQVFGARSFSIWNGTTGALVYDSGDDFEQITATDVPSIFNSNGAAPSFDTRSDNKGPEPESITTGTIKGRVYAFVGLERTGGVMVYDITDPMAPTFVLYEPNAAGALAPEGLVFVPAGLGPDGRALLIASNEVSGTVSIYEVQSTLFALTILHNNDAESKLISAPGQPTFGGVARFKTLVSDLRAEAAATTDGSILLSSGDNFLAGPEFNASLQNPEPAPIYDAMAMDALDYDAICIGNHEFDFGPEVLARFIGDFPASQAPFLSANLDVSAEPSLDALAMSGRIASRTVITVGGESIGIVGATTPALPFISSPDQVIVDPNVVTAVQTEVDALVGLGIDKIVLISHLQSILEDQALIPQLRHVDVAIAGGGDEILSNPGQSLVPGDVSQGSYPRVALDLDGRNVPIITTGGDYKYVGRLVACFDDLGNLAFIDPVSGPVRVAGAPNADAVASDPVCQAAVVDPVQAAINSLASNVIATTCPALEGRRPQIRNQETNLGDLVAEALLWQANELAPDFGVPLADVAIQNGGGIRNNSLIPSGPFTELNTFQILAFANFTCIVEAIPPAQFKEIMENAVSRQELADGRWAQISGFSIVWSPTGTPQVLDAALNVTTPGTRIVDIRLADGTWIVRNGVVEPGAPDVNIATIDFSARGGDQYPYRGAPFTTLGVTYQQSLYNYVTDFLGGLIDCDDYPTTGLGRITQGEPVAVTLSRFEATTGPDGIDLAWATSGENDHSHFNLYRRPAGSTTWSRINAAPIGESLESGGRYAYRDADAQDGSELHYRLEAVDRHGRVEVAGEVRVLADRRPKVLSLSPVGPNPFADRIAFTLDVPLAGPVRVRIFDASGRLVRSILNGESLGAGRHSIEWDGRASNGGSSPAGAYYLRAEIDDAARTVRVLKID